MATNVATGEAGSGGGLSLTRGALVDLEHVAVQDNRARRGGGAYVVGGSTFVIADNDVGEESCNRNLAFDRYCSEITTNHAEFVGTVSNEGGAIYSADSTVTLMRVGVQQNTALADATGLYFASGTTAYLENTLVAGSNNAVHRSTVVKDGAALDAKMSTFADEGTTLVYEATATGNLHGNIIWPRNGVGNGLVLNGAGVTGGCNVGLGVAGLGTVQNPNLLATVRGGFRIDNTSPAWNSCGSGPDWDVDGSSRPLQGIMYDAGFYEVP